MKKLGSILMLLALCLISCNNTDDLQDDVDALKIRVTALESQIRDINRNIESVSELVQNGIFITRIEEQADAYALTLNNGKTLSLYMKNDKNLLCPLIGIDKDGYWTVCYDTEAGFKQLLVDGEPVKAKGEDGKTPEFTVDADGFWKIRYGKEEEFRFVYKEGTTEKVSATGGGSAATDSFFEKVEVADNELVLTLKGNESNTVIRIPIVNEFELSFAGEVGNTVQEFAAGETRMFEMTVRGVESTMISAPEGWTAVLNDAKLTVTAPATNKAATRATADNSSEIAILATHGKYAMIAKIQVKVNATEPMPTPGKTDYYTDYTTNGKLTISDVTINKTSEEVKLLTGAKEEEADIRSLIHQKTDQTVIFLEKGVHEFKTEQIAEISGTVVLIGRYSDSKPVVKPSLFWKLKSGKLILKNIRLDLTNIDGTGTNNKYMFNNSNATSDFEKLVFEDCEVVNIKKNLYYNNIAGHTIKSIHATNNRFLFNTTEDGILLFNLYKTTNLSALEKFTFDNNIVYSKTAIKGQVLAWDNKVTQSPDTQNTSLSFCNNTIVNYLGANYYLKLYDAGSVTIRKNIFCDTEVKAVYNVTLCATYKTSPAANASTFQVAENIAYGLTDKNNWIAFPSASTAKPDGKPEDLLKRVDVSPFQTIDFDKGIFTPTAEYKGYGAEIK